ncbi:MAG: NAD(P)/FAD-dependent oxidoreductase [Candidatus Gracilibacteria bacterium]
MAKKHSTTALTAEDHKMQDERYAQGHEYDYVFVGTGNSALVAAALLANAGKKICMLEAHDIPGGYAQTFEMGNFKFCAQVHYIWGCAPGGLIYEFLKKVGLEKDITFEVMGPEFYDLMAMPDGKKVGIPYGFDKLVENIEKDYPGEKEKVEKFCKTIDDLRDEMARFPNRPLTLLDYITKWPQFLKMIKYRKKTVQDLFDECGLSKEAQAILCANAGDFMLPPNRLSLFSYAGLFGGYNTGSYYPTKHFKYYVDRLASFITDHEGCHIYYETKVTKFDVKNGKIAGVETEDGKRFEAKENFVCNMDPQSAAKMIGWEYFSAKQKEQLSYEYSQSGVVIYLGLKKGFDLREHGFGSFNIWHLEQWDMNKMWDEMAVGDFSNPWVFLSTPTLHTHEGGNSPDDQQILELASYIEYKPFKERADKSYKDYVELKMKIADRMIDLVEEKYIPNLRDNVEVKVVGSPMTSEDFVMAPVGNAYGSAMTVQNVSAGRLKAETPFSNLWWCNASSGYAGMYGTAATGVNLYMQLTGDEYYTGDVPASDDKLLKDLRAKLA